MRLFAAIVPPPDALAHLLAALSPLQDDRLRWSDRSALHITLAFYGTIDDTRFDDLIERLGRVGRRHDAMELRLSGAGRFDDSVLWVGVRGETEPLRRLAPSTAAAGRRAGATHAEKRSFRPHITVARARSGDLRPYVASLADYDGPQWRASEITLIRSHLGAGPGGRPRYETMATVLLRAA